MVAIPITLTILALTRSPLERPRRSGIERETKEKLIKGLMETLMTHQ